MVPRAARVRPGEPGKLGAPAPRVEPAPRVARARQGEPAPQAAHRALPAVAGSGGGFEDAGDASYQDAPADATACLVIGEDCDPANDTCCDLLFCDDSMGEGRCRPEPNDGSLSCSPPNQPCTMLACCPGLACIPTGPTEICRFPQWDGGIDGGHDGGDPDAAVCMDLYTPCGGGLGSNCCPGLECKKDPPAYTERQCLPVDAPDANLCPSQTPSPGDPCTDVGLQCSYGMMTVCTCFASGWQCAYLRSSHRSLMGQRA